MTVSDSQLSMLRKAYPKGTRIRLLRMDDPYAVPDNAEGTVQHVDDNGMIVVLWDYGMTVPVNPALDTFLAMRRPKNVVVIQSEPTTSPNP